MLHHAAQKKPQQASIKIKVIKIREKLQNLCMIDGFVHLEYASGGVEKPKPLHLHVNKCYMVFESLLHPFGQAKAPQCITRLSLSNCAQQESKVLILVPRVATGNPLKQPCWAVPPRPCLGSIAVHDVRCTTATPFIKGCLTEAILIPHMNHAANVSLDTKRIIT
jgi:hypothetical protein